jgi:hypothetical protein
VERPISLDRIPPEIVIEIVKFIPNQFKFASACALFYQIVCERENLPKLRRFRLKISCVSCIS